MAGVDVGSPLRRAKHVHNPVMANPVASAEILVRVVVAHAPANATGDFRISVGMIQYLQVSNCVGNKVLLRILPLGRMRVTVEFSDHVRRRARQARNLGTSPQGRFRPVDPREFLVAENEIVHRVDVFQQLAVYEIPHAGRLSGRVQLSRQSIGPSIEIAVVGRFVYPDSPQDDRWPVPVAPDHPVHVLDGLALPVLVADVLPSRDFLKDQQSDPVAMVEEPSRLRIMGGAHQVAFQVVLQNFRVPLLRPSSHRIADVRVGLMAIQPKDLEFPAVQEKPVRPELGMAKPESVATDIHPLRMLQRDFDLVERRSRQVPELDPFKFVESQIQIAADRRNFRARDLRAFAVQQAGTQRRIVVEQVGVSDFACHLRSLQVRKNVGRFDLDPLYRNAVRQLEPDVAVNPGIGQIIDLAAERRDGRIFAAIYKYGDKIVAFQQAAGQIRFERRISVQMRSDELAIEEHARVRHRAVEHKRDSAAFEFGDESDGILVAETVLVAGFVRISQRKVDGVVRKANDRAIDFLGREALIVMIVECPSDVEGRECLHRLPKLPK